MRWATFSFILGSCLLGSASVESAEALTDTQILQHADIARGRLPGGSWNVELTNGPGDEADKVRFEMQVRGNDFLAEYLGPPRQKGDKLLMVGGNMWFYKPGLSKPVPISQRQKLTGTAAYGDISGTNYADDYESKRQSDETRRGELCHVFMLKAKPGRLTTYDSVRVWISKKRLVSVRAEYFTVSGKLFKSVELDHDQKLQYEGEQIPFVSEARFVDELVTGATTVMRIKNPHVSEPDNSIFDVSFMAQ